MTPGDSARNTGDINLASALMAVGIPLDPSCPVKVIESESSERPYASFRLLQSSTDGANNTDQLMRVWSGTEQAPHSHPFAEICRFIKCRPSVKMNSASWLDYAVDYLTAMGFKLHGIARLSDIESFVKSFPKATESYVLAFVHNRNLCIDICRHAVRTVHLTNGTSHLSIDTHLPAWQKRNLLAIFGG